MSSELKNDGLIDSEWCEVSIADLCLNIYSGGTPKSTEPKYFENGVIPWLKTKEVNYSKITETENFITTDGLKNSSAKLVPVNSVIVAMYGNGDTAGRVAINKIELTTNQACCNLVIDPEKADYRFVYYYLMSQYSKLVDLKNGGAQQNLNSKLIKDFPIQTPELATQGEIGAFLESLDDRIALLRETNATLEAIAQALFKSWFVDFDPVHANAGTQAPSLPPEIQALFPATFTDSPQGTIPEGWKVEKFSSVIDKYIDNRGKTPPTVDVGIPLLEIKHLSDTEISPSIFTEKKVDQETYDNWFRAHPEKNDILMSTVGTIGRLSIMGNQRVAIAQNILGLRVGRVLAPEFMYYLMKDSKFKEDVNARLVVTVQASIKRKDLETIDLLVPDTKIQEQFTLIVSSLIEQQRSNDERAQALMSLRDTLLPRLISGQLRLPEAEQAIAAITD